MNTDFLWVEQYRPKTIDDCILPDSLKSLFSAFVKKGEISNMLFSGTAGIGKTTVAKALCNQMNCDWIMINGSEEGGIDVLRNKIKNFASTVSFNTESKHKVVIIDEADYMNAESVQPALRNFIETFYKNCRFILTCNYPYKFIEPLRSRFTQIDFKIVNGQKVKTATSFLNRLGKILDEQEVSYDKKVLAELIQKHYPDFRKTINELQRYSVNGKIDSGIFYNSKEADIKSLFASLKKKDFNETRKWVVNNLSVAPNDLFRIIYDSAKEYLQPSSTPQAILLLAGYQYKSAFVADQEINMVACLTEIMATCKFK